MKALIINYLNYGFMLSLAIVGRFPKGISLIIHYKKIYHNMYGKMLLLRRMKIFPPIYSVSKNRKKPNKYNQ